jgi:hypothetical protein
VSNVVAPAFRQHKISRSSWCHWLAKDWEQGALAHREQGTLAHRLSGGRRDPGQAYLTTHFSSRHARKVGKSSSVAHCICGGIQG